MSLGKESDISPWIVMVLTRTSSLKGTRAARPSRHISMRHDGAKDTVHWEASKLVQLSSCSWGASDGMLGNEHLTYL
jgi:hypothetical protein